MNYLAHLYLSEDSGESMLGSIIADFVKGPLIDQYPAEILTAIDTHRKVDSFTDTHEMVLQSRKLFSSKRRRFAGIILDVVFDHFLAKNWALYSELELNEFIAKSYAILKRYRKLLPGDLKFAVPKMIEEDWLGSYRYLEAIGITLDKISKRIERRFNRENDLSGALEEVALNYSDLETNFKVFFPELITYVVNLRKNGDSPRRYIPHFFKAVLCHRCKC
jgi:acyl carrier protein phosphodiesterase